MILMCSQALILAQRFARAFDRAEHAEQEVTKLNQGLEQKIVERTEQINTILSHVRSGFLLVDRDSHLQTGFTSSSETILGRRLQVGLSLPQQLGFNSRLEMQFSLAIQQIYDSDLPTEVAMQQLPSRFPMDKRVIGLQAAAVKSRENAQVTAVLLTINDVTDLVAAEEGLRRADILIHILEDQDAFRIFLVDFKKDLEAAIQAIQQKNTVTLHSILHTMKGNAASFNLDDWVARLHQMEEKNPIAVADLQDMAQHVRSFLRQNEGILHLDFDHPMRSVFGVDQNDLNALKETLDPIASPAAMARVESWSRSVQALPLKSYATVTHGESRREAAPEKRESDCGRSGSEGRQCVCAFADNPAPFDSQLPRAWDRGPRRARPQTHAGDHHAAIHDAGRWWTAHRYQRRWSWS
jgi:HPt (histidine-containing phosphotransfer) domain-containing protein